MDDEQPEALDGDELGRVEPWQIKQFPRRLRLEIAEQARQQKMPVGDFVLGFMLAARASGWKLNGETTAMIDGFSPSARQTELDRAARVAAQIAAAAPNMPDDLAASLFARVKREYRLRRPRHPALPAPKMDA